VNHIVFILVNSLQSTQDFNTSGKILGDKYLKYLFFLDKLFD